MTVARHRPGRLCNDRVPASSEVLLSALDRPLSRVLRDVTSLINSSVDLETTLQHLVDAACQHDAWSMAAVMSIDQADGNAVVVTRHDPSQLTKSYRNRWTLATSPSLIALTRNDPVIIRDAQESIEFPGYREEAIQRGYRTVVVLPLGCRDMEDRAMVLSVQSRDVVDLSAADLAFLQTIVHLGAIAVDKAHRLRAEHAAAAQLQNALAAHSSLMHQVLSDGSVASAASMVETFLPNAIVVVDLTANLVVAGRSPKPDLIDTDRWREEMDDCMSRQFLRLARDISDQAGLEMRKLYLNCGGHHLNLPAAVEPLVVDGKTVGALIVFSLDANFGDLDHLLLQSARFALSVQLMRSHLRFQTESQTSSELFMEIVSGNWRNVDDLTARARRLGIDVNATARLVAIGLPETVPEKGKTIPELHRSIMRLAGQLAPQATAAALGEIILCRIPDAPRDADTVVKTFVRKLIEETQWLIGTKPIIVAGKTCSSIHDYPQAWLECERMIRLAVRFNRTGLLAPQDFGPFPLLLSAADSKEVRSFVDIAIGAVVRHDEAHATDYIRTLTVFLEHGCRSQACADAMELHVTTLRYRLNRIHELFGIEIDSPERRFALELAIRLNETIAREQPV
ncbi:helix-turn-helix domain-containing protein [Mesorhizobium sp. BR1-1-12]|uniref:helix-turn-helix domain-containing protein n=1 Tax=unclassified Mesorhizobium TaxID=325217 RepID=UPI001CCEC521|nr:MULTISPECIES: helix-turn-helix domain-containing protein [unclassified Mesorhizobium]MBZ9916150.1 helix-turn-helix domain-containing protein [Mesorhizobium sp. BR1-1-7]MBZ9972479.1 helix-turn-helix domain-containing protein [Mesorhizobium sp. BR1-1-12]